ncbi:MAG TPA: HAMP domain-containing sensor histidine kinase [Longimicrobiales bacterium]
MKLATEVAHDLRSPLTSMLLLTETLQRGQSGPVNAVQARQLGIIRAGALGLMSIVDDMIALGTNNRALMHGVPTAFSITDVLLGLRDAALPIAEQKGLDLVIRSPMANDLRVGNRIALSRVLLNLVCNALKYTDEGRVEVDVVACGAERIRFSVRDTGVGLPDEALERLRSSDALGSARPNSRFSSTTLGLKIVQSVLAEMGAQLTVETEARKGTRFTFELDLPPAAPLGG